MTAREMQGPLPPRMYPAVSAKHSKEEAGKSSGQILKVHHAAYSRRSKPVNGIRITAAGPAYMQLAREAYRAHPHPTEIIRMRLSPLKRALCYLSNAGTPSSLIQSSPRNTCSSSGGPSPCGRRCTAISAGHTLRTPTRLTQTAFLPQHIQRGTQW